MVKIEECDEDGTIGTSSRVLRNGSVDPQSDPAHASFKLEEECQPSSSSNLRSEFIGMGFLPLLVDKMLQKHGDHDFNIILESLLSNSAPQNFASESSSSLGSLFDSDNEENNSPLEANQDIKPELDSFRERRSYLLKTMNFSQEEVDLAFHQLGEEAPLGELVDCIVTAQGGMENGHVINEVVVESLYGEMDKMISLLKMGFTEEEVSAAIDNFGQETTVQELADSIFARRIADTIEQKQVKIESEILGEREREREPGYSTSHQRLSYYDDDDDEDEKKRVKKAKHILRDDDIGASTSRVVRQSNLNPWSNGRFGSLHDGSLKKEDYEVASASRANIRGDLAKPPYFLYGNVADISRDSWVQLSGFLFSVQPEFVDAQSFSALVRKEGYIHNLPREKRRVPKSKMANLDRVGQGRFSTLQPHQLERLLGYPTDHTDLPGLNPQDRVAAMTYAFQVHTIGYLLSVLKELYPDGLRVLSIYSGVGGAEIALNRLSIPLKCVVSVEESEVNRKVLKRWWAKTGQTGKLRQLPNTTKLNTIFLEDLMDEFGGFDLVVGGTYSSCRGGTMSATMGMDYGQFHEYLRIVKRVRSMHGLVV